MPLSALSHAAARGGRLVSGEPGLRAAHAVLALLVTLAAFRYAHEIVKLVVETSRIDFGSFYTFTAALWRGHDPFQPAGLQAMDHLGIPRAGTPPTFAPAGYLFFLPFVALPYETARVAWLLVGQGALFGALWALYRRLAPPLLVAAGALAIVLGYQPLYEDVGVGNLNLVVLFLLTLAVVPDPRARPLAVALPLSLALHLKLYCVALLPLLVWFGAGVAALLTVTLAVAWTVVALLVFGTAWLPGYVHFLAVGSAPLHAWARNLSPHAILHRLADVAGPQPVIEALALALALGVAVLAAWGARGGRHRADAMLVAWAAALAAMPLLSPLTEEHHLVVSLIPLLFAISRVCALGGPADVALLAGATALLAGRYSLEGFPVFATGVASLATAGKAAGAGLLLAVIVRLARAPEPARA
jgi:glycosyl transferase family 87